MINTERIVPVEAIDLISLYGLILKQDTTNNASLTKLEATDPGEFAADSVSNPLIANEPLKALNFGSSVSSATVYFVPAYNYAGFTKTGATVTATGTVDADGRTLYKAVLSTNAVTITKAGF